MARQAAAKKNRKGQSKEDPYNAMALVKETILLVDDEEVILDIGQEFLKKLGYRVFTAGSGRKALEIYRAYPDKIDMVILDIVMPDWGGMETYERLKEINPEVRVLIASGFSITGQATEMLKMGCRDFMQKPFNMTTLSQKIRLVLELKTPRRSRPTP